ncbi:precorrin-3B C(17)-methyltransferase [Hahella sp. KA22]|uniref:precorrin-3B C(17)-methyltransferase n=1 Tax=Hahella sp. KA22 TaxID=1628392 RepID=UPI000FDF297C|nr:precorrin-3B C(17)-methyltransferase [Hahella sp. KA22]AZZ94908.1 precorrin-3B C(17)-methyltransferase [Hahella sp. KA22]QAY52552.1 precorrin-3B C(17)-methyltransferase [Hahella sp. KA22]
MKRLYVLGSGPGSELMITPQVEQAIAASSDLVAYGLYLELLGERTRDKTLHDLPLGEEIERARLALNLAAAGKPTALISSGDIGIFAMATLVFELLERQLSGAETGADDHDWRQVDIQVMPGVSAMQAAAASMGAALGHDFCAVSLSDLLTPWETIETRIRAVAAADFVIAFYNPVSRKRRWQLARAKELLMQRRPADTPVILGRNLTRQDERVSVCTLAELDVEQVDMLTLVLVGSSATRCFQNGDKQWVYTPRGYARKLTQPESVAS